MAHCEIQIETCLMILHAKGVLSPVLKGIFNFLNPVVIGMCNFPPSSLHQMVLWCPVGKAFVYKQ